MSVAKEKEQRTIHSYVSKGKVHNVACTRREFLFLKLTYSDAGLSIEEYEEYKNYLNNDRKD